MFFGRREQGQTDNLGRKGRFPSQTIQTTIDQIPTFEIGDIFKFGTYHRHLQLRSVALRRHVLYVDGGGPDARQNLMQHR